MSRIDDESLQSVLSESPRGIAGLLRLAAHPARIQLLTLLLKGKCEFSKLMQETKLSKTALANHLRQLVDKRLAEKLDRGEYALTIDGKELLSAAALMYQDSTRREEERRESLSKRYTEGLKEDRLLDKKVVTREAEYLPCWLSYTGAIAGALKALGVDCDPVDVGGHSGYAFLINVAKQTTCPSGPTALGEKSWAQILKATEELGWTIRSLAYDGSYPKKEGDPAPEEVDKAKGIFEKIKQEVNERDRPAVLWGLVAPEYGIVNGYDGNSYVVSTFRRLHDPPLEEDPIPFYDLKAPGCLHAIFFGEKVKLRGEASDKNALRRDIDFASGKVPALNNYVVGPVAFQEWARVLETLPEDKQNYHGNSYVGACYCESRGICAEFLKRLAKKYPGKQSGHLLRAAECYENGLKLMREFTQVFPFRLQGDMKLADRKKGAKLLRQVKLFEEEAIRHMTDALAEWGR